LPWHTAACSSMNDLEALKLSLTPNIHGTTGVL
jgi:hypothetical protein